MQKVSIIIPVYNSSKYLEICLKSVISQTYNNIEVILIDDGSDDGSAILCDDFAKKDPRIHVFHQNNQGMSSARNCGVSNCSGEFVLFVDSDDFLSANSIKRMVDESLKNNCQEVAIGYRICEESANEAPLIDNCSSCIIPYRKLVKSRGYYCWGILYRADVIRRKRLIFPENIKYFEDLVWNDLYFLDNSGGILYIPDKLYQYRNHPNSVVHTNANFLRVACALSSAYNCLFSLSKLQVLGLKEFIKLHFSSLQILTAIHSEIFSHNLRYDMVKSNVYSMLSSERCHYEGVIRFFIREKCPRLLFYSYKCVFKIYKLFV